MGVPRKEDTKITISVRNKIKQQKAIWLHKSLANSENRKGQIQVLQRRRRSRQVRTQTAKNCSDDVKLR